MPYKDPEKKRAHDRSRKKTRVQKAIVRVEKAERPEVLIGFPLGLSDREIEVWMDRISIACASKEKRFTPQGA